MIFGEQKAGSLKTLGSFCRYRKALYFWSLGISLYLELFCFLSFITIVLRNLCSGTHRRNQTLEGFRGRTTQICLENEDIGGGGGGGGNGKVNTSY